MTVADGKNSVIFFHRHRYNFVVELCLPTGVEEEEIKKKKKGGGGGGGGGERKQDEIFLHGQYLKRSENSRSKNSMAS